MGIIKKDGFEVRTGNDAYYSFVPENMRNQPWAKSSSGVLIKGTNGTNNATSGEPQNAWEKFGNDLKRKAQEEQEANIFKPIDVQNHFDFKGYKQENGQRVKPKREFKRAARQEDFETPEDWASATYGEDRAKKIMKDWEGEGLEPEAKATVDKFWDLMTDMQDNGRKYATRDIPYVKVGKDYFRANKGNRNNDNDFSAKYGMWGKESNGYPSQEGYDEMKPYIDEFLKKYGQ